MIKSERPKPDGRLKPKPNPGSREAQQLGCTCPVMDNHYGNGVPDGKGAVNFWMIADCPLHGINERKGSKAKKERENVQEQ